MAHFRLAPTCRNLCAPQFLYAVGSVVDVAGLIGNIAVLPDLLPQMNGIASVLEVSLEGLTASEIVP